METSIKNNNGGVSMKALKSIIIGIFVATLLLVICYFLAAFIALDLDFRQWSFDGRMMFLLLGSTISVIIGTGASALYCKLTDE